MDTERAKQLVGEVLTFIDHTLLNAAVLGTIIRNAKSAGFRNDIAPEIYNGDELAAQVHLNLLERFEQLMHSGLPLDKALECLRKEGWHTKIYTTQLKHLEN